MSYNNAEVLIVVFFFKLEQLDKLFFFLLAAMLTAFWLSECHSNTTPPMAEKTLKLKYSCLIIQKN